MNDCKMNDCKMNVVPSQSRPTPVVALDHVGHRDEFTPSLERQGLHHEMVAARATSAAAPPKYLAAYHTGPYHTHRTLACLLVCMFACLLALNTCLPTCLPAFCIR